MTNNPVGRYGMHLLREGALDAYMGLLLDAFNPEACEKMMCRNQISVGWDGRVYDCDFNQVEELPCQGPSGDLTIFDLAAGRVQNIRRPIRFGNHCYAAAVALWCRGSDCARVRAVKGRPCWLLVCALHSEPLSVTQTGAFSLLVVCRNGDTRRTR